MRSRLTIIVLISVIGTALLVLYLNKNNNAQSRKKVKSMDLPAPLKKSSVSIEQALQSRRSVRDYKKDPLTLKHLSQLLWAAQGITHKHGFRTAPSAGALYPIEIYCIVDRVSGLARGTYKYNILKHQLDVISETGRKKQIYRAALRQECINSAAVVIIISGVTSRTTGKYSQRGIQYVYMESGFVAQNIYLQAVPLKIGTVIIGAFDDEAIQKVLNMQEDEYPLCLMPVGYIRD